MKKSNNVMLYRRVKKEFHSRLEAKQIYGYESYSEDKGIATFKEFFSTDDVQKFIKSDKSLGFGLIDSVGSIEEYYPRENDNDRCHDTLMKCIEKAEDPKYKYYWEIPDDGIIVSKELLCHDHYGSASETCDECGNCSGSKCCDDSSVIKRLYKVYNYYTDEIIVSTYDMREAYEAYSSNKLKEEATRAFDDICKMLKIDGYGYKCNHSDLNINQLVYKIAHDYDVRVKTRH